MAEIPVYDGSDDVSVGLGASTEVQIEVDKRRPDMVSPSLTGGDNFTDLSQPEVSGYQSFMESAADSSMVGIGTQALNRDRASSVVDPDHNIENWFTSNPGRSEVIQQYIDNLDDPASDIIISQMSETQNGEQLDRLITEIEAQQQKNKNFMANSGAAYAGMAVGIGSDVGVAIALSPFTGGASFGLAARTVSSGRRTLAMARSAKVGAVWGGGYVGGQSIYNPMLDNEDILEAAGFGAGFGAVLGLAFPTALGNVRLRQDAMRPRPLTDDVIDEARAVQGPPPPPGKGGDAGAALAPGAHLDPIVPAKGAGGVIAALPKKAMNAPGILQNPKRWLVQQGVRANERFEKLGLTGGRKFYDTMARTLHFSTINADEVAGKAARRSTVDKHVEDIRVDKIAREEVVKVEYNAAMSAVYGADAKLTGIGKAINRNTSGPTQVSMQQFEEMADELAHMQQIVGKNAKAFELPADVAKTLTPNQQRTLIDKLKATAAKDDEFYMKLGEREVAMGILKPEELIKGYRPQRWDVDEIAANPAEFDQFLRDLFEKNPSDEWVRANWLVKAEDGTSSSVLKADETFDDLARRDPELADEIVDEWSAGVRGQAEDKAFIAMEHLKKEEAALRSKLGDDIEARYLTTQATITKTLARLQKQLDGEDVPFVAGENPVKTVVKKSKTFTEDGNWEVALPDGTSVSIVNRGKEGWHEVGAPVWKKIGDKGAKGGLGATKKKAIERLEGRMRTPQTAETRGTIIDKMGRAEKRFNDIDIKLSALRSARKEVEELDMFIRKFGNAGQKKALGVAAKKAGAASRREAQASAKQLVNEEVESVRKKLLDGDSPFGFIDDAFINNSSRFKRRSINIGNKRQSEGARKFLQTNSKDARASYVASTSPQIGIREVFGQKSIDDIMNDALSGFDDDLRKTLSNAERKRVVKERKEAATAFKAIYNQLTHADMRGVNATFAAGVTAANTGTAIMSLGGVLLAQMGDLMVMAVAGGRMGLGFRQMINPRRTNRDLMAIMADDAEIGILLRGPSSVDGSRFKALAELDSAGFDVAGGKFKKMTRGLDHVATIQGWANMMHMWNLWVRGSFGLSFAKSMAKDLGDYGKTSPQLRSFYAKHGFDEASAKEFTDLMRTHGRDIKDSSGRVLLRVPDQASWAQINPGLLQKYRLGLKSAGDEAMLDPGLGDRPFMRSNPMGRLLLQFQSFTFTAGERLIAPMVQELRLHPTSTRPYWGAMFGMFAGMMTDGAKHAVRGEGAEWAERWQTEEGFRDNLWGGLLRSPLMAGASGTILDVASSQLGRQANNGLDALGAPKVFKESKTRFQENKGLTGLLGPTIGTATTSLPAIARNIADGDMERAIDQASRKIPIMNTFYIQALSKLWEKY